MTEEQPISEADYHHGAEKLAEVVKDFLLKGLVEFELLNNRIILRVDNREIIFLTQPEWTSDSLKKVLEFQEGGKITARFYDVQHK